MIKTTIIQLSLERETWMQETGDREVRYWDDIPAAILHLLDEIYRDNHRPGYWVYKLHDDGQELSVNEAYRRYFGHEPSRTGAGEYHYPRLSSYRRRRAAQ